VAAALLAAGARPLAETAAEALLAGQQANGGWGYHRAVPDDLDSTAYAVAFLARIPGAEEAVARGLRRLAEQQRRDGGFATYGDGTAIRAFMSLPDSFSLDGWTAPHPEVTASTGRALATAAYPAAAERAWAHLAAIQQPDGRWRSYWWTSDLYATAQAVALARDLGQGEEAVARARDWCLAEQAADGGWRDGRTGHPSAFATALALLVLAPDGSPVAVARGRDRLLAMRRADGGWDGEHALRLPPPWILDPREWDNWTPDALASGAIVRDAGGSYVTATALRALAA